MDNPTPDAVALAFREMAEADPEYAAKSEGGRNYCNDCMGIDWGDGSKHAPDCPWLRRKQARERAEKAWKEREALVEKLLLEQIDACVCRGTGRIATRCRLCEDDTKDHECVDEPVRCVYCFGIRSILAALKGAPTK